MMTLQVVLRAIDHVIAKSLIHQSEVEISSFVMPELVRIRASVEQKWPLSADIKKTIAIGRYAAKNIDDWNSELANKLMILDYSLKHDGQGVEKLDL